MSLPNQTITWRLCKAIVECVLAEEEESRNHDNNDPTINWENVYRMACEKNLKVRDPQDCLRIWNIIAYDSEVVEIDNEENEAFALQSNEILRSHVLSKRSCGNALGDLHGIFDWNAQIKSAWIRDSERKKLKLKNSSTEAAQSQGIIPKSYNSRRCNKSIANCAPVIEAVLVNNPSFQEFRLSLNKTDDTHSQSHQTEIILENLDNNKN